MIIAIFIFGILIGSFLNVCIYRIPKHETVVYGRSHCMNCNNEIKWYDLIPILSFLFLRGKCRYCKEKLSLQYPLIEFITGMIFLALYYCMGLTVYFIVSAIISCIVLVLLMIKINNR